MYVASGKPLLVAVPVVLHALVKPTQWVAFTWLLWVPLPMSWPGSSAITSPASGPLAVGRNRTGRGQSAGHATCGPFLVICQVGATRTGRPPSVLSGTGPSALVVGVGIGVGVPRGDGAFGVVPGDVTAGDPTAEAVTADADDEDGDDESEGPDTAAPAGVDDAHAGSATARTAAPAAVIRRLRRTAATLRREPENAREGPPDRASPPSTLTES